ncbi:MAG: AAA family ATPase [Bacteroidota bacterium]
MSINTQFERKGNSMKITLKDFGPISHFEFDLEKDLHVIFGKNSVGKSYAISVIYLVLKNLAKIEDSQFYQFYHIYPEFSEQAIKRLEKDSQVYQQNSPENNIDFIEIIQREVATLLFSEFTRELEKSLKSSFPGIDQLRNCHSASEAFSIILDFADFQLYIKSTAGEKLISAIKIQTQFSVKQGLKQYSSLSLVNFSEQDILKLSATIDSLLSSSLKEMNRYSNSIHFLPSSRSGLYQALNTFSALLAELSKSRNFLTSKIELPNISEPVSDYFLSLSNISSLSNSPHHYEASDIEKNILNGEVLFNESTKKLYYRQFGVERDFELSFTSSMVSEISPIVGYLKYILREGNDNILFIEEPEAHLHPEVQVKLMEQFAALSGKRLQIVMTSHSNYMFNKLSNLILDNKMDHNKVASYLMRPTEAGSVADMLSMKAEEDGMNDKNFADTAEMLYEERIEIYERLNNAAKKC